MEDLAAAKMIAPTQEECPDDDYHFSKNNPEGLTESNFQFIVSFRLV
jgi:hypothetical protein